MPAPTYYRTLRDCPCGCAGQTARHKLGRVQAPVPGQPEAGAMTREEMRAHPLAVALQVSVPLVVADLKTIDDIGRTWMLDSLRKEALPVICERGDVILYPDSKGRVPGETGKAFAALVRGMAALSFNPGGFEAFGLHWCARHSPAGAVPTTPPVCSTCLDEDPAFPLEAS